MIQPKKLHFGTAGLPNCLKKREYINGLEYNTENNLLGMEMEFVRGVRMKAPNIPLIKDYVTKNEFLLTAHGPYYINLNPDESDKYEASVVRILDTARMAYNCGAYSVTFHAAYYMKKDPKVVYSRVRQALADIVETLKKEGIEIWVRPELTGKQSQFGDLDELIKLSNDVENVLPCIDFSHMHARLNGYNGYDNFARILERMGNEIGERSLQNFHGHVAGIEYTEKGERRHLNLVDSDFLYRDLIKALKDFNVKGMLVCESPNIEEDAKLLLNYYNSLGDTNG